jgi:hypothetical protein
LGSLLRYKHKMKAAGKWKIHLAELGRSKRLDLTGQRYGRFTVLSFAGIDKHSSTTWQCQCDCGAIRTVVGSKLRSGRAKSCGCLSVESFGNRNRTHGLSKLPEYTIWKLMRGRCNNPNGLHFADYGGRGIKVCERWTNFENFYADMGSRPSKLHSIDRINNNGCYEPSNCQWATQVQQTNNRRPRRKGYKRRSKELKAATD